MSDTGSASDLRVHYGCVVPDGLLYDVENDVWVRREGEEVVLGMTDPAQTRCGKIVAIQFRGVGKKLTQGRGFATIESAKWVGAVPSPVGGTVLATNESSFREDLLIANRDPYGRGWLVRMRLEDPAQLDALISPDEAFEKYKTKIDELKLRCYRCADDPVPMM